MTKFDRLLKSHQLLNSKYETLHAEYMGDVVKADKLLFDYTTSREQADKLADALRDEIKWLRESLLNKEIRILELIESRIEIINQHLTEYDKSKL